jgi:hypothetical protein
MIPRLGGIVEYRALCCADNILQRHVGEFRALYQFVERVDIFRVVFAVVIFQRFARDFGLQRIQGVG